jgi:hypothetical protein
MNALDPFPRIHKSSATYLDLAANDHGAEKALLASQAIARLSTERPSIVEIGPGGGAAVRHLAGQLRQAGRQADLTLIEAPGVKSQALAAAMREFDEVGAAVLVPGLVQDLTDLLSGPVDVVTASAVLHEVYSYGGAYAGLHALIRTLPSVLRRGGFFAYRDVYAIDGPSLHEPTVHSCGAQSWLLFLRMFTPYYLREGTHPYHHLDDGLVARQDSRIVPVAELDARICAVIHAPIGLFREIQRHYLTFRDHAWRSGALGFTPILDGQLGADWIDFGTGHKRVHYRLTDVERLSYWQRSTLRALSEPYSDHYTIDGDIFDEITEVALMALLGAVEHDDPDCAATWSAWRGREGRETYAYMTVADLLASVAIQSLEVSGDTMLVPVSRDDVLRTARHYYNRFLGKQLANAMRDAKQLVLFQHVLLNDAEALAKGLQTLGRFCGKQNLARIHTAIHSKVLLDQCISSKSNVNAASRTPVPS